MSLSFTFPVGSGELTVTAENPRDLVSQFEAIKGDGGDLISSIKVGVGKSTTVPPTVQAVSGNLADGPKASSPGESATPADPWSDDAASTTQTASPSDPWADEDPTSYAPANQTSQSGASANASVTSTTDKFGRKYTFGLPEAPPCACGVPAAKMNAKAKATNKPYAKWLCAKAAGTDWKNKCDFDDFLSS